MAKETEKEKEMVPAIYTPIQPLLTAEEAANSMQRYQALIGKLLVDEDYQAIQEKRFIKKSGLRKIALAFGISDRILSEERNDRADGSFLWRIKTEAITPNGRSVVGVGACDSRERKFVHLEHDCYAMAATRSKNRAISDLVAHGVVSAEEVDASEYSTESKPSENAEVWHSQRDGGECIRVEELQNLELKAQCTSPDLHFDYGSYHYRTWEGTDGVPMLTRYAMSEKKV